MEIKYRCPNCGNNVIVQSEEGVSAPTCQILPECNELVVITDENVDLVLPLNPLEEQI